MSKFHKIQKLSSVVPFYSSFVIFFITMFELRRYKASVMIWGVFFSVLFLACSLVYILNTLVITGENLILNLIASGSILAIANIICVNLQIRAMNSTSLDVCSKYKNPTVNYILIAALIIFVLIRFVVAFFSPKVDIPDTNGTSDNALAIITLEEILSTSNHFTAVKSTTSSSGSATDTYGELERFDYDRYTFTCKKISGIKTLMATKVDCNQLTLFIDSDIYIGNMGIYIIIDGEYYDCVEPNQAKTIVLHEIEGKTVLVKLAAESADLSVTLSREYC